MNDSAESAAGHSAPPPSARERLAAAREAAGMKPSRAVAASAPGAAPRRKRAGWLLLLVLGLALLAAAGWWWATRDSGLVDDTRDLQQRVLAGEVRGRDMKRAVDSIIRNVDQMSRDELKQARESLDSDWRTAYDKGLAAYFDAPEDSRPALLDEAIDRTLAFRQLRSGLNPQAPPRRQPPARPRQTGPEGGGRRIGRCPKGPGGEVFRGGPRPRQGTEDRPAGVAVTTAPPPGTGHPSGPWARVLHAARLPRQDEAPVNRLSGGVP